jgi:hypothetical protein
MVSVDGKTLQQPYKPFTSPTSLVPSNQTTPLTQKRMENDMNKLFLFVIALALSASWAARLQSTDCQPASLDPNANAAQATNAAFRD